MKIEKGISKFVIDASVAVKWFSPEILSDRAEKLLAVVKEKELTFYEPEILFYEVGNALWKGKRLEGEIINGMLETLRYDCRIEYLSLTPELVHRITSFMTKYDLTFYDAAYAGVAFAIEAPLVTADPKDHLKVKEVQVIDLAKTNF